MSDQPPDPLEGQLADSELIYKQVMDEVDVCIWTATGGTDGCAQCSNTSTNTCLSFKERIERGHPGCAQSMARDEGARDVKYRMSCGGLDARLLRVVADPRLGQWKQHLDDWSKL